MERGQIGSVRASQGTEPGPEKGAAKMHHPHQPLSTAAESPGTGAGGIQMSSGDYECETWGYSWVPPPPPQLKAVTLNRKKYIQPSKK